MPAGTTGEGPLLSDDEIESLVGAVVEAASGRVSVLAHVGRPGTQATVHLARRALAAGADSVSAVVPYYYALDDGALVSHYRALLAALPTAQVYAYTIPSRTRNELAADAVRLLAGEGLAGVKDSHEVARSPSRVPAGGRGQRVRRADGLGRDGHRGASSWCGGLGVGPRQPPSGSARSAEARLPRWGGAPSGGRAAGDLASSDRAFGRACPSPVEARRDRTAPRAWELLPSRPASAARLSVPWTGDRAPGRGRPLDSHWRSTRFKSLCARPAAGSRRLICASAKTTFAV
jgi:hypothetical protein